MKAIFESPTVATGMAVFSAYKAVISPLESAVAKQGCSTPRLQIMYALYFDGPKQQSNLAKSINVSRANISTFIKRLIEDQLIEPIASGGKRPGYILTQKGIADFEMFFVEHIKHVETLITPVDDSLNLKQCQRKLRSTLTRFDLSLLECLSVSQTD